MKATLYWSYATRSLLRGGQRTLLAIFCVAVGVMAIVSLQQVGNSIDGALSSNVRAGNGGDISVRSDFAPFTKDQLSTFNKLQSQGVITTYTAISSHEAQTIQQSGKASFYSLRAVNPTKFPISGQVLFQTPANDTLQSALSGDGAVITDSLAKRMGAHVGQQVKAETSDGTTLTTTIRGIIRGNGLFSSDQMLVSLDTYAAAPNSAGLPLGYTVVYANVPGHTDANAAAAKKAIAKDLAAVPLLTITTTQDALQKQQSQVQQIRYFLQIVGLLALLIGGVGIVNTMQVLLRRRQTEIAMLKTAGYRKADLYLLFGLEASILGITGGVVGAAAGIGAGVLIERVVEGLFAIVLPTGITAETILSGIAIGFFTALIFGLMPIVQAAQIRPLAVLRGGGSAAGGRGTALTLALGAVLVVLFFLLAWSILQNLSVAAGAVVGTGIFLLLLSAAFTLVVIAISRLPIPDHVAWSSAVVLVLGLVVSAAIAYKVPALGAILGVLVLLGIVGILLPSTGKANAKMALRNIGRQPGRTVTTLVALFIGVFAIGLILVLGQNIKDKINNALASNIDYNSVILASASDHAAVSHEITILGKQIKGEQVNTAAYDTPVAINGVPIAQLLPSTTSSSSSSGRQGRNAVAEISAVEGYDLGSGARPSVTIVRGRNLSPSDAGTANVIMPKDSTGAPLHLAVGDQISMVPRGGKQPVTVKVVGFYTQQLSLAGGGMYSDNSVADTLSAGKPSYIYLLKVDPRQSQQVLDQVQQAVPSVQTFSIAELTVLLNSLLNDLIIMLTTIASLAMIAGVIIIANAVALAMLERRREIGILKSVGYTSRSVLGQVLLENGIIGFAGSTLAMLLVVAALAILGAVVFNTTFGFSAPIVLAIIGATAGVCMLVAALVAWSAARVRPLEVLRYE